MWYELRENGKCRFKERYIDPNTMKEKTVSVTMPDHTRKSQKLAQEALRLKIENKMSADIKKKDYSLREVLDIYLDDIKTFQTLKEKTIRKNESRFTKFVKILGEDILINKLTPEYISRTLFLYYDKDVHKYNECLTRLKVLLNYAYEHELTQYDITRKLKKIKEVRTDSPNDHYLEPDELNTILDYFYEHKLYDWYYLTKFLVLTGMRIGEAIALNDNDIDLDEGLIKITKTIDFKTEKCDTPKTDNSFREIDITPELEVIIKKIRIYMKEKKLKNGLGDTTLFMFNKNGGYIHYDAYRKCLKENGLQLLNKRVHPHMLRHTHTSLLASKGIPVEVISRRLGHSDSRITKEVYLHVTKELKEKDRKMLCAVNIL